MSPSNPLAPIRPALPVLPVLMGLLALAPAAARADDTDGVARDTEPGFLLNLKVGLGYTRLTSKPLTVQGAGSVVQAQVGALLTPQLGFFGQFSDCTSTAPAFYPNGQYADHDADVSVSVTGLGAGAIYYLRPGWLYTTLGAELVWAQITETRGNDQSDAQTRYRSSPGVGGNVTFGRDWWMTDDWAIGAAGYLQVSYTPDQDDTTFANSTFGVTFSATYN